MKKREENSDVMLLQTLKKEEVEETGSGSGPW
jgi:hypothetical protein